MTTSPSPLPLQQTRNSARLLDAGDRLVRENGATAILLGGTDLNLVYDGITTGYQVIDSAAAHADAIVKAALRGL